MSILNVIGKSGSIHCFAEIMLDVRERKTNIHAHIVLDATIERSGSPKFSRQVLWSRISGLRQPLLRREEIVATLRVCSAQTA